MKDIILASNSPRRKELLEQLGFPFRILPAHSEEHTEQTKASAVARSLAQHKAQEVFDSLSGEEQLRCCVIGADTIVAVHGLILGKPKDMDDARRMITLLQGGTHKVFTGVCLIWVEKGRRHQITFHEKTKVTVYPMRRREIEGYIATREPYDKAGAYGIQGTFSRFIEGINGDYSNVVGLPVAALYHVLTENDLIG